MHSRCSPVARARLGTGPRIIVKHVLPEPFRSVGADRQRRCRGVLYSTDGNPAADVQNVMAAEEHPGEAHCDGPGCERGQGDGGVKWRVLEAEKESERHGPRRVTRWEGELVRPNGDEHLASVVARAPTTCKGLQLNSTVGEEREHFFDNIVTT